jgi:hypothetical protein
MNARMVLIALCLFLALSCSKREPAPSETQTPAPAGQEQAAETKAEETTRTRPAPSGGYSGALIMGHRKAKDTAALLSIRQSIQAFHALNERYPEDLEELESEGYPIPEPPNQMAYDYNPTTGEIELYYTGPTETAP